MRIASPISRAVAGVSAGTSAPVTTPPRAWIVWQPAQSSAKSCCPCESEPLPGLTVGIAGPPKDAT